MAERTLPKRQLTVTHCEIDVPYKQGTKFLDRLQAIDNSLPEDSPLAGKPLRMTIFSDTLKHYARGKEHFIADIQERDRPEADYGPDRTIVQIYDEQGQPVQTKKQGGGGNYRRSLDDDLALEQVKRRSIEGQTAVAQVGQVLTSPTDIQGDELGISHDDWLRILGKYWQAVEKGLDNYLETSQDIPPKTPESPQDKRQGPSREKAASKAAPPDNDTPKHFGDLLTRASKLDPPVPRREVLAIAGLTEGDSVENLNLAALWNQVKASSEAKGKAKSETEAEQLPFE